MKKKNKIVGGKMVITTKIEFDMLKQITTKEGFYKRYTLCMSLVTRLAAENAMTNAALKNYIY